MYPAAEDGNWSDVSIVSFWKVVSINVGSINFVTEKIFLCAFRTFRLLRPLEICSQSVTGVVILSLIITITVDLSIVYCVNVLFASGIISGSFSVLISISGICPSFFLPSNVVTFSMDGKFLLGMSKVVVFFLRDFSFTISSSIFL